MRISDWSSDVCSSDLARRHDVSQRILMSANDLRSANKLRIGQVLKIPPKTESRPGPITVAVGESKPQQTMQQRLDEARKVQSDNEIGRASCRARVGQYV